MSDAQDAARFRWLASRINWRDVSVRDGDLRWNQRVWAHYDYRTARPDSESIQEYIDRMMRAEGPPDPTNEGR